MYRQLGLTFDLFKRSVYLFLGMDQAYLNYSIID